MHPARLPPHHPLVTGNTRDAALIRTYHGETSAHRPVWFMRQAGRSLPEYRALRVDIGMLDACLTPELAAEITLQPVRRHRVDAAIFFSDIVVPLKLLGVPVDLVPGRGPVFSRAYSDGPAVAALTAIDPAELDAVTAPIADAIARVVAELGDTPLIGFAGAPFTLAAYLVHGGPSKDHLAARTLMHRDPGAWHALMGWLAEVSGRFMRTQVLAGASAAQLFDSWAGALGRADYERFVLAHSAAALAWVPDPVPTVHFGVGTGDLLPAIATLGVAAIGVDYRTDLAQARRVVGDRVLQGNLDPALLAADWSVLAAGVRAVLAAGREARGHVFNLGHGVPPDTDPDVLTRIVELVHEAA